MKRNVVIAVACMVSGCSLSTKINTVSDKENCRPPLIIGHRGAPGHTPEHTLHSYKLAIEMGADYIEPDLVPTKDGALIVRHENEISETTDVAKKFPKRQSTKTVDGVKKTGWYTEDFTLKEIKTLRAKERLSFRSQSENGKHEVVSFAEVLQFVREQEKLTGRSIGVAPELKHPTYFNALGFSVESKLVAELEKFNLNRADAKIMVQCFEQGTLQKLRPLLKVNLVQLLDESNLRLAQPEGLLEIAKYAEWVSPHKSFIVDTGLLGAKLVVTDFMKNARAAKLKVVPYTFRSEPVFLSAVYKGDPANEYYVFFRQGVDAVFTDFTDHAVAAKKYYFAACER